VRLSGTRLRSRRLVLLGHRCERSRASAAAARILSDHDAFRAPSPGPLPGAAVPFGLGCCRRRLVDKARLETLLVQQHATKRSGAPLRILGPSFELASRDKTADALRVCGHPATQRGVLLEGA
jgi:hypothetical protein